ncbi:MAG: hypothetical protein FJX34_01520 [Alphaproteobacteria bacterium]|nr:hypothetical protein [Alphaproteobacteria bacterium]
MKAKTNKIQKITVHIPQNILLAAMRATSKNITETVKQSLEETANRKACENFRSLRGKVKFSINLKTLREDR